jgi:hypothetical protein
MNNKLSTYIGVVVSALTFLSGCSSVPVVSEVDVFKYEKNYLYEYEQIRLSQPIKKTFTYWTQPINKKEDCKVYDEYTGVQDQTSLDLKYWWDGNCKDGYANGLGREFTRGHKVSIDNLARYTFKGRKPQYYLVTNNFSGVSLKGDINRNSYEVKRIIDTDYDFDISLSTGYFPGNGEPKLFIRTEPLSQFQSRKQFILEYPNFSYVSFIDKNQYADLMIFMSLFNNKSEAVGYGIMANKNRRMQFEVIDNVLKEVPLPIDIFIAEFSKEFDKAQHEANIATENVKESDRVIKEYTSNVCKKSISVDFINNEEYKKICENSEYKINLKAKISKKLAETKILYQVQKEDFYKQQMLNAQIGQARAASRAADSAESSARAAENANFNQSMQNMRFNSNMQNINNNLHYMRQGW